MTGEDERRKPCSLYAPTPLIRTSSGTHTRPLTRPRSARHTRSDPVSLPVQLTDNPAGLLPPELPPKDPRRRLIKDAVECVSPVTKKPPVYFKKVFHGCPLKVNCSTTWENPATKDQHLILGAEEGIYTLNLNSSEATMELMYPGKCTWVYTISNVLMSVSGKSSQLHSHSLKELYEQARKDQRVALPTHRLLPRKYTVTCKIPDTKGCKTCSVAGNMQHGCVFLCCALESTVVLLQWYEPMHKFMLIKHFDFPLPSPLRVFEMLVVPQQEYPLVCIGVSRGSAPYQPITVDNINLNSNTSWFTNTGPEKRSPDTVQVNQLDSSSLLVLIEKSVHIVGLEGELKSSRTLPYETCFNFDVEAIVYFDDTLLAVWRHGWQRRGEGFTEILEETNDPRKIYRLVGSDRMVVLETRQTEDQSGMCNLYILEIAENYVLLP
uniref:mitogen-activated protein kinase kinase kinase kinase 5 n=1 Tax=Centroberyx gerrardi TaxID=166262 RepID=UPI003AABE0F0